jgi:streptomycin 6-kinase
VLLTPVVRARAAQLGDRGYAWMAEIDDLLDELGRRWGLTVVDQLAGGTAAVVLRVRDGEARDAVLKLAVPDVDVALQIGTLVRARGRGYARVLAADPGRCAVLVEALGPSLDRTGLRPEDQLLILCDVLGEAWTVPPEEGQRPLDKAGQLHDLVSRLWRELGPPYARRLLDRALACAAARSDAAPQPCVVVHGDAAAANCLRVPEPRAGAPNEHVFVDPDGFLGDPAYDLGVALRDWTAQLLAGDAADAGAAMSGWCALVAERTALDATAIEQWALLERISTGLVALSLGLDDMGRAMLRSAELLSSVQGGSLS